MSWIDMSGTVVNTLSTVVIAVFAFFQWRVGSKQANLLSSQNKLTEKQQELEENYRLITQKPLIVIPYEIHIFGGNSLVLYIQNMGNVPIKDIKFFFNYEKVENSEYSNIVKTTDIKNRNIEQLKDYAFISSISELMPQRMLIHSIPLPKNLILDFNSIINHNTTLDYDAKSQNAYHRMYFIVYGAIKYKSEYKETEEVKCFYELVEFRPIYNIPEHRENRNHSQKKDNPAQVPNNMFVRGIEFPTELSPKNRTTILTDLNYEL